MGDGAAVVPADLVDVVAADLLRALEGQLRGEVGAVNEAVVVVEEGSEVLGDEAHDQLNIMDELSGSIHADLVLAILGEVLDPRGGLVAGAVHDLEVPDLEAGDGEEGDFEVDVDGLLLVEVALGRLDGGQLEVRAQHVFPA